MSRVKTVIAAAVPQAWKSWRSQQTGLPDSNFQIVTPNNGDESRSVRPGRPLHIDTGARLHSSGSPSGSHPYGYVAYTSNPNNGRSGSAGPSSLRSSPERHRHDSNLGRVPEETGIIEGDDELEEVDEEEEEEEEEELELEEQGLYRGSYTKLLSLYSLVPLLSLLLIILLALLPSLIWRLPPTRFPTSPYFSSPLSELLISISLWSLSHIIRVPIYTFFSALTPTSNVTSTLLSAFTHVTITNILRLSAIAVLNIRHTMDYLLPTYLDPAFQRVIWLAIGWSIAEVVVGIAQGYEQILLYKDVLVPEGRAKEFLRAVKDGGASAGASALWDGSGIWTRSSGYFEEGERHHSPHATITRDRASNGEEWGGAGQQWYSRQNGDATVQMQVEKDLDQLLSLKAREEIEEVYGIPAIKIPVFISCLQRVNSIVLSQGLNLLLSAAYLSSPISQSQGSNTLPTNRPFAIMFPVVIVLHLLLSILHTPLVLPNLGLHCTSYVGLLVGLGCLFAGLAMWGALS